MTTAEATRRTEDQPRRKVLVSFSGRLHSPLNVQGVNSSLSHLSAHLEQFSGQGILLLESANGTASQAEQVKKKASM